ncbi:hypothetical protein EON65_51520 [archaeon]|nr:MAG: hypothetical protein EON65_51520 [archaeon]
MVIKSTAAQTEIPPGALITFLQKGLEYIAIEEHITEDGTIQDFDNSYSLLTPMICEALVMKEDRRLRKSTPATTTLAPPQETPSSSQPIKTEDQKTGASASATTATATSGVKLVEEEGGQRALRLLGHQGEVFTCVWNPHRHELATGSADGVCRLWGLQDTQLSALPVSKQNATSDVKVPISLLPHVDSPHEKNKDVTSVTWSPDGKFLATGSYDGKARIWSAQTGEIAACSLYTQSTVILVYDVWITLFSGVWYVF